VFGAVPAHQLDPSDYWEEPGDSIYEGDVFLDVPLLSLHEMAAKDEADQIFLPTAQVNPALLIKQFKATWWFVPVLTREAFGKEVFDDHLEQCLWGNRPGWFVLPPLEDFASLNQFSLVLTIRPTIHHPDAFEDAENMRVASLTSTAYEDVCSALIEGLSAP
jgi:hypothetical protein